MAIFAIDPNKPEYSVDTEGLGRIDILPLTNERSKTLDDVEKASASSFLASLISAVGRKDDGSLLEKAEVEELSENDKSVLAEAYLENNSHLYVRRTLKHRKNDEGETVAYYEDDGIEHPKDDTETAPEYLLRLQKLDLERQR